MNRRGHLSSKIPNVKLRPAPAGSNARTRGNQRSPSPLTGMDAVIHQRELEGEEDEEVSTAALRNVVKPWKDIVITFTGVDRKTQLAALATELGARVDSALTVHVTHVVAVTHGSDKYNYAIEHRLPVLSPDWIEWNHQRWLNGEDVEYDVDPFRLPPFEGLIICMSGIEPIERRKQIVAAVNEYGGRYSKDLTRECTHLISAKPTSESKSSEKVQWACKELRDRTLARRRGKRLEGPDIRIIYEEWLWDCVAYHGRFSEDLYDAKRPRPAGKVRAEDVLDGTVFQDQERAREQEEQEEQDQEQEQERGKGKGGGGKLKTEEANEEGPAVMRKRKRDDLVEELISTTTTTVKPEIREDGMAPPPNHFDHDLEPGPSRPVSRTGTAANELRKRSLLHATRTASFGLAKAGNGNGNGNGNDPLTPSMPGTLPQQPSADLLGPESAMPAIFAGLRFSHLIDEAYESLERALIAHGGKIVSEQERIAGEHVDHVIVRLSTPKTPTPVPDVNPPVVVTECWVEGCCFEQALLPVDKHLVFRPLPAPMPVEGSSSLSIHLSGFSTESLTYLRRLIRVIGATQAISLNKQTTHLVSGRKDGQKVDKARQWGIKTIAEGWLLAIGRAGTLVPELDYPLDSTSGTTETSDVTPASASALKSQPVSQARELKPTPTHVDGPGGSLNGNVQGSTSGSALTPSGLGLGQGQSNPLSPPPPNGESARKLNQATAGPSVSASRGSTSDESVTSRVSKTSKAGAGAGSGIQEGGSGNVLQPESSGSRNKDVTDVLRELAGRGDTPSNRVKAPRRSKGVRPRTSLAQRSITPLSPNLSDRERGQDEEPTSPDIPRQPVYEESMRVSIADPAAERERKKMMDALKRNSAQLSKSMSKSTTGTGSSRR